MTIIVVLVILLQVKFNVNKSDNMIIQSIALLDQLDKDVNTFCMRIREWYSYHFPELAKIVSDNHLYAKCVKAVKNRKEMPADIADTLEEILMDSGKARAVIDASKMSMGMDISIIDLVMLSIVQVPSRFLCDIPIAAVSSHVPTLAISLYQML